MKNNILRLTDHSLPEVWITPEKIHSGKHIAKIVRLNPDPGMRFRTTSYFLERIRQLVKENLEDDQYGIADICRDAGVSRTQLHRNIRKHANTSTSIFIRNLRIQHGKLLLEHTDLNITQVAFAVGFSYSNIETVFIAPSDRKFYQVYPNPTTGVITVVSDGAAVISVVDMNGRILLEQQMNDRQIIDVSRFSNGLYILKMEQKGILKKLVFVKQ